jgi:peptide chain release factor 2
LHVLHQWRNVSTSYGGLFDIDTKREDIQELEAKIASPGFWDDSEGAQKVLKERTAIDKILEPWGKLYRLMEDIKIHIELGSEAEDEETLAEVHKLNDELAEGVNRLEFQRMLSGTHDSSNCFVSINAGAGGTEANVPPILRTQRVEV